MKILKEWIAERINDDIYFFDYGEFSNLEEINEGTKWSLKKANLKNRRITVAIKNLDNNSKITKRSFKGFINKIKTFSKSHQNINRFLGLTKDSEGNYFSVWKYIFEGSLRDYLKDKFSLLQWNDKIQMALDITSGLMFLHSEAIVHGNLDANNIFIKNGRLMIADLSFCDSSKQDMEYDIYRLGILLLELSIGPLNSQGSFSLVQTYGKIEDPVENTPLEYQRVYQECWHEDPDLRPEVNEVYEILSQLKSKSNTNENLDEIFKGSLTPQQIIKKVKLNYGLILTEYDIQPGVQAIFAEDGELKMSLYEGQPMVYTNINGLQPVEVCINFPIAEITYKGDLLESFSKYADDDEKLHESFGHFFARKILLGGKIFIKKFGLANQTQI
ncbi:kinase-like domain-containing protein, partial [Glomus cerebriforme]